MRADGPELTGSPLIRAGGKDFRHGDDMLRVDRHERQFVQQFPRVFIEHFGLGHGNELVALIVQQIQKPGVGQGENRAFNSLARSPNRGDNFFLFDHAFVRHAIYLQTGLPIKALK